MSLIVLAAAPAASPESDAVSVTTTDSPTFRVPSDGDADALLTVGVLASIEGEFANVA